MPLAVAATLSPITADAANTGFVRAQSGQFVLNGAPFRFVGTNAYFMSITAADGSTAHTTGMMSLAHTLGFTVLRTWGFADGPSYGFPLQPTPGVYDETNFRALDWVLAQADAAGVRLILTLVNHWGEFGGMPQYLAWCAPGSGDVTFYTHPTCRQYYKNYVSYIVNRVNTLTGRRYKDDPTIFAWELANEPRCVGCGTAPVRTWVAEMAAFIKALDPNHMVATGEEGYDDTTAGYSSVATYNNQDYLFNGWVGVPFTANTADPNVDYASAHLYPEYWGFSAAAGNAWIADHVRIARRLGKPFVLGEFGMSSNQPTIFDGWLQTFETEQGSGALAWEVICQACAGYYGGLGAVYPPTSAVSDVMAGAAALANSGGSTPLPPPPTSPPPAVEPSFTIATTSATPNPVRWNRAITINTTVSATAAVTGIVVDLEILDAAGTRVALQSYSGGTFTAGQTQTYQWNWRARVPVATYTVKVSVFAANRAKLYTSKAQAASFSVVPR